MEIVVTYQYQQSGFLFGFLAFTEYLAFNHYFATNYGRIYTVYGDYVGEWKLVS